MQRRTSSGLRATAAAIAALLFITASAQAQSLGGYTCLDVQDAINIIYKRNGYCFQTEWARRRYGNAGCAYDDQSAVPIRSAEDREALDVLVRARSVMGCAF